MKKFFYLAIALLITARAQADVSVPADEYGKAMLYTLTSHEGNTGFDINELLLSDVLFNKNGQIAQMTFTTENFTDQSCFSDEGGKYCEESICKANIVLMILNPYRSTYTVNTFDCEVGSGRGSGKWQR